jgi:S1-C subfamily serine protease
MARLLPGLIVTTALLGSAPAAAQPEGMPLPPPFERGRIGLQIQPMTAALREHMKAPREAGVLVVEVEPGSPAAEAGVRVADVITRAGEETVATPRDLIHRVGRVPEGETLALELVREGKKIELEVKPSGSPGADAEEWKDWMRGGFHHGLDALQRRLDELERRLDELERRLPEAKPA